MLNELMVNTFISQSVLKSPLRESIRVSLLDSGLLYYPQIDDIPEDDDIDTIATHIFNILTNTTLTVPEQKTQLLKVMFFKTQFMAAKVKAPFGPSTQGNSTFWQSWHSNVCDDLETPVSKSIVVVDVVYI